MIIILAICQGFAKHLIRTQHQAEMDSRQRHCLPLTNSLLLFCPRYLPVFWGCSFFQSFSSWPLLQPLTPAPCSQFPLSPPAPTSTPIPFTWLCRARVGESVTMETGAEAAKGCRCERGEKETKKTKNWSVLRNPGVVFRCRYSNKKQGANDSLYFWCGKSRCKSLLDFFNSLCNKYQPFLFQSTTLAVSLHSQTFSNP